VLTFSPYAHAADANAFGINDPFTDALQLWSAALSSIELFAHQLASALQLHQTLTFTAKPHAPKTPQQPAALAASAALATESPAETATTSGRASGTSITPQQPQTTGPPIATSDQTTSLPFVKSGELSAVSASNSALAATPASAFVTQAQFNAGLSALGASVQELPAKTDSNPFTEYGGGDGNNANRYAAASAIGQLSNVTVTNANLTASEIPALNYLPLSGGTLSGDLTGTDLSLSGNLTVGGNFTAGSMWFSAASSTGVIEINATTTNLVATNATSTNLFAALGNFTEPNTLEASIAS
jgi:hypothetical protein